jgi:DNA invertase Pin-like site-specific DNA recombinase
MRRSSPAVRTSPHRTSAFLRRSLEDAGISGAKSSDHRPGLADLLKAVARRKIDDLVAAWSVGRLGVR